MAGRGKRTAWFLGALTLLIIAAAVSLAQKSTSDQPLVFDSDTGRTYYVATDGSDKNDGLSEDSPFETIQHAADIVEPGDTVYIRGGVYPTGVTFTVSGTSEAPITFASYPGEHAILDGSDETPYKSDDYVVVSEVSWNVFKDLEVRHSPNQGIYVEYSDHNVFADIVTHDNTLSGIQLYESSDNRLLGIESFGNYDENNPASGKDGDNADGIGISSGQGNYIFNCRTYRNSDDGLDTWKSTGTVIDGCVSFDNGRGSHGNGNGFKLGPGQAHLASTLIRKSVAFGNDNTGFTTNGGGGVVLQNNTAYDNGVNFAVYIDGSPTRRNEVTNNIAARGKNRLDEPLIQSRNSWNLDISDVEFVSTDPKSPDFLKLSPGSPAIDAGAEVGLLYYGTAPDLGAHEYGSKLAEDQD